MFNVTKKILLMVLIAMFALWCNGCAKEKNNEGKNMAFAQMTQEERKEYVKKYILETYGEQCSISKDIKKREINSFSSEEFYYAIAVLENNNRIYCWITDDGEISDSKFVLDVSDEILSLFTNKIDLYLTEYKIKCSTTLNDIPEKMWNKSEVEEMLAEESLTTSVRIFVEAELKTVVSNLVSDKFNGSLDFAEGVVYIYYVDDLETLEVDNYNLSDYDELFEFERK